jgi:HlyD family secretion protein
VAVLVVALIWSLLSVPGDENSSAPTAPVFVRVEQGPLTIAVNAAGSLRARDQVVVSNNLEGQTTILSIIDEGKTVKEGDLLIELDSSLLQSRLIDEQIAVQGAKANFVQARENLEIVKNQAQSDIEAARLAYQFAKDDLNKYQKGEFPNQKKEELSKIALKQEELRRAEEKLSWSKVLFAEKFLSQTELEADDLAAQKARIDLELSQSGLELLLDFTNVRRLTELRAAVESTELALDRVQRKAKANTVQAAADLQAKQALLERENMKLDKLLTDISKTTVLAPQAGVVVYATSLQRSWRGNAEPLAAGQSVRERQELIYLPASGAMVAQTQIHESNLEKVHVGQAAQVYVDSINGRSFAAQVKSVAMFPDAASSWLNPDLKLYRTELELSEYSDNLRSGMNCRIEIQVAQFDSTIAVPIQAVVLDGSKPFVYVERDGVVQRQAVQLGENNESLVQILEGVSAGDRVQINPPITPMGL